MSLFLWNLMILYIVRKILLLEIMLRYEWFYNGEWLKLTVEYIQSCEELGAVPRFVMCHQSG
jgi:hypothetical protein